ncbi:hypothetical protein POG22_12355 [Geitlerinema sp. CS-897]|nr:hypothetical protein [Geitlerinema sp. CS-897]
MGKPIFARGLVFSVAAIAPVSVGTSDVAVRSSQTLFQQEINTLPKSFGSSELKPGYGFY